MFLTASFYQNLNKGNIGNKVETKKEEKLNNDAVSIIGMDISTFLEVNEEPNFKSEVKNGKVIWVYTFPEDEDLPAPSARAVARGPSRSGSARRPRSPALGSRRSPGRCSTGGRRRRRSS